MPVALAFMRFAVWGIAVWGGCGGVAPRCVGRIHSPRRVIGAGVMGALSRASVHKGCCLDLELLSGRVGSIHRALFLSAAGVMGAVAGAFMRVAVWGNSGAGKDHVSVRPSV